MFSLIFLDLEYSRHFLSFVIYITSQQDTKKKLRSHFITNFNIHNVSEYFVGLERDNNCFHKYLEKEYS